MKVKTRHLDIRVEEELIEKLDTWRNRHQFPPSRAATVCHILDSWFKEHEAAAPAPQPLAPAQP